MPISIIQTSDDEHQKHQKYDVMIEDCTVHTIVTRCASVATDWLSETNSSTYLKRNRIVVGFDTKLVQPSNCIDEFNRHSVAIILLCVGNRCLIYQIFQRDTTDNNHSNLERFLASTSLYRLIGENIMDKVTCLFSDYTIVVTAIKMELTAMVANVMKNDSLRGLSVREVAGKLFGMEIYQPIPIENRDWEREILTMEQVMHAVTDVYLCYKIGMALEVYKHEPDNSCVSGTSRDD